MESVSPFLSICIPTYNRCQRLSEALACWSEEISQCDLPIEVVVADNCSTDGTAALLQQVSESWPALRVVRNDTNIGGNRNILYIPRLARGRYAWIFGDDDLVVPGTLGRVCETLIRYPQTAHLYLNHSNVSIDLLKVFIEKVHARSESGPVENGVRFLELFGWGPGFMSASVFLREAFVQIDGEKYLPYWFPHFGVLQEMTLARPCYYLSDPLVVQRIGPRDWASEWPLIATQCLPELLWSFTALGYPKSVVRSVLARFIREGWLAENVAALKRSSRTVQQRSGLRRLMQNWGSCPAFWWRILPLYLLAERGHRAIEKARMISQGL